MRTNEVVNAAHPRDVSNSHRIAIYSALDSAFMRRPLRLSKSV